MIAFNQEIILASASPRRAELLDQIDVKYTIQVTDINEDELPNESAEDLVQRLAKEKSLALGESTILPVLGADTLGVLEGKLLVKPQNFDHAHEMLSSMAGQWHEILSAVAISYKGNTQVKLNRNRVLFRPLSDDEIKAY